MCESKQFVFSYLCILFNCFFLYTYIRISNYDKLSFFFFVVFSFRLCWLRLGKQLKKITIQLEYICVPILFCWTYVILATPYYAKDLYTLAIQSVTL